MSDKSPSENINTDNFGLTDYAVFISLLFVSSGIGIYYAFKVKSDLKILRSKWLNKYFTPNL